MTPQTATTLGASSAATRIDRMIIYSATPQHVAVAEKMVANPPMNRMATASTPVAGGGGFDGVMGKGAWFR